MYNEVLCVTPVSIEEAARTRVEDRITRNENDIDRLGERLATALHSITASVATLQLAQTRQDTKLDHIVELQSEARNASGSIERLSREIASMNAANKAQWEQHKIETDQRWENHRRDLDSADRRNADITAGRITDFTEWRTCVNKDLLSQDKKISNWGYAGGLILIVFSLIILPLLVWTYRTDIGTAREERGAIVTDLDKTKRVQETNSEKIRSMELYLAKDPNFKPAVIIR